MTRSTRLLAAAMLIAARGSPELVSASDDVLVPPSEVPPGGADLNQPFQLWMMPIRDVAPAANVRHDQVILWIVTVCEP